MNVMVLGSGGMIGRSVRAALVARGHYVISVTRSASPHCGEHQCHIQADRSDPASVRSAIKPHRIDALVDMVAFNAPGTRALLEAISGDVSRYVLVSSADVYRNYGLLHRRETGLPDPGLLAEDAPLRATRYPYRGAAPRDQTDPARWMDEYDKILVEDAVRQLAENGSILRLPMVFGDGDPQARFRWALHPILTRAERVEIPHAWLAWTTTYGHVRNVADAVAHAVTAPKAQGRTFNLTDDPPVSHAVWFKRFADAARWTGEIIGTNDPGHPIARATAGIDLDVPFLISGAAFAHACDWKPPQTVASSIAAMIAALPSR
jgi:nucleoside-diphosphate-sugar epimerase